MTTVNFCLVFLFTRFLFGFIFFTGGQLTIPAAAVGKQTFSFIVLSLLTCERKANVVVKVYFRDFYFYLIHLCERFF